MLILSCIARPASALSMALLWVLVVGLPAVAQDTEISADAVAIEEDVSPDGALESVEETEVEEVEAVVEEKAPRRPAVKALNAAFAGQYLFDSTDLPPNASRDADDEVSLWLLGGRVTAPLPRFEQFGARAQLSGGRSKLRSGVAAALDATSGQVGAAFDLFWRDPEVGTAGVQYEIVHQSVRVGNLIPDGYAYEENRQVFSAFGALFLGDLDVDAAIGVQPRTAGSLNANNPDETGARSKVVFISAGPSYYVNPWLALRSAFLWQRSVSALWTVSLDGIASEQGQQTRNRYEGQFAIDTQLPTTGRGPVLLSLFGGVGGDDLDGNGLTPDRNSVTWNVGGTVRFVFPRPESLKQWRREYR